MFIRLFKFHFSSLLLPLSPPRTPLSIVVGAGCTPGREANQTGGKCTARIRQREYIGKSAPLVSALFSNIPRESRRFRPVGTRRDEGDSVPRGGRGTGESREPSIFRGCLSDPAGAKLQFSTIRFPNRSRPTVFFCTLSSGFDLIYTFRGSKWACST